MAAREYSEFSKDYYYAQLDFRNQSDYMAGFPFNKLDLFFKIKKFKS